MANLAVTNTFSNGVASDATAVNTNFNDIVSWTNVNTVRADGTIAFTAVPSGPATDPTTANQLVRKSYVDDHDVKNVRGLTTSSGTTSGTSPMALTATASINDPGYNLVLWGGGSNIGLASTTFDSFETYLEIEGTAVVGVRIPYVAGATAGYCAAGFAVPYAQYNTGTYGATLTFRMWVVRTFGTGTYTSVAGDPRYGFFDIFYKKA